MTILSLNLFQVIALCVVGFLMALTALAGWRGWINRREWVTWSALWLAAGGAMLFPHVLSAIAKRVGIGRGTDLLVYCAVVVMMIGFLMIYVRLRRLRREMTLLVRHLAIRDAARGEDRPDGETAGTPPANSLEPLRGAR